MTPRLASVVTSLTALTLTLAAAGCGSSSTGSSGSGGGGGDKLQTVASFYPLEYALQRIGGDHVAITDLTKPGAEPHELELTPQDVAQVSSAKLAVYEKGLQPAVDKAIEEQGIKSAYDVARDADLTLAAPPEDEEEPQATDSKAPTASASPAPNGGAAKPGTSTSSATSSATSATGEHKDAGGQDPHFWLDPQRYAKVVRGIAAKLGEVDSAHKADYDKNADAFVADLTKLDSELAAGLKTCTNKTIVTSHAAFGYLAQRYQLAQEPIAGLSPDQEPDPARLGAIAQYVKGHKVSTIYTETLASPAVAQTVAKETGAQTAVLDPIEGITDKSSGKNYLEVMRSNLDTLKKGQSCK